MKSNLGPRRIPGPSPKGPTGPRASRPFRDLTPSADRPDALDLSTRWIDVRRIARSRKAWREAIDAGADPDDLDQVVMEGVLRRQQGGGKYNPKLASVASYLSVVTHSLLKNHIDHLVGTARARREVVGAWSHDDDEDPTSQGNLVDASTIAVDTSSDPADLFGLEDLERELLELDERAA